MLENSGLGDWNQVKMITCDFDVENGFIMAMIDRDFTCDIIRIVGPRETYNITIEGPYEQGREGFVQVKATHLVKIKTSQRFIVLNADEIEFATHAKDNNFCFLIVYDGLSMIILWISMYFLSKP